MVLRREKEGRSVKEYDNECTCVVCGKDFMSTSPTSKCCSRSCFNKVNALRYAYYGRYGSADPKDYELFEKNEFTSLTGFLYRRCKRCRDFFRVTPTYNEYCSDYCKERDVEVLKKSKKRTVIKEVPYFEHVTSHSGYWTRKKLLVEEEIETSNE